MSMDINWFWHPKRDGVELFEAECGVGVEWHGSEEGFSIHAIYFEGKCLDKSDKLFALISGDIEADAKFKEKVEEKFQ